MFHVVGGTNRIRYLKSVEHRNASEVCVVSGCQKGVEMLANADTTICPKTRIYTCIPIWSLPTLCQLTYPRP